MPDNLGLMFSVGLLGSLHCIGMCGGLVGALALGRPTIWWSGLLVYQLGRVTTYALFGLLVGALGASLHDLGGMLLQQGLAALAGLFMIIFGLNLAGWLPDPLASLTTAAAQKLGLGRLAAILTREARLLGWFGMGMANGMLPCGLVYAALAISLAAGGVVQAGSMMAVFGLGTIPAMLLAPALLHRLTPALRGRLMQLAAIVLIGLGVFTMLRGGHGGHAGHAQAMSAMQPAGSMHQH